MFTRFLLLAALLAPVLGARATSLAQAEEPVCAEAGQWVLPLRGEAIAADLLYTTLATRSLILLGEHHDNADHHRWQLATIAALAGRRPDIVLGFEMFTGDAQPVLDRWVHGDLTEEAFLEQVRWDETWGYDAALYLPLLHFARLHRVPMVALNVDRSLIRRVAEEGWEAIPTDQRLGIGDPIAASGPYRQSLAAIYAYKSRGRHGAAGDRPADDDAESAPSPEEIAGALADPGFDRFVAAQLTWDRAMAEALAAARDSAGGSADALIVGIIGQGHLEHGWGVPRQLEHLGSADAAVLLPMARDKACPGLPGTLADAVFVYEPQKR
ncbi:MAG: ChaN family lipoprotein [Rhodospirillales bacterium]|nr:ChaN family lipoprotein [Rhodospirillales bacterium]